MRLNGARPRPRLAQGRENVGNDLAWGAGDADRNRMLVGRRLFQRRELAFEQLRRHEMAMPGGHPLGDERLVAFEINKTHGVMARAGQNVAIAALQRRARDDAVPARVPQVFDPGSDRFQPRLAVGIAQGRAAFHLLDIGLRMKPIAVFKTPAEFLCEQRGDGCLART
jgi:hypothetical protein